MHASFSDVQWILDAYALTGKELYRQVAEELIDFLSASFSAPDGGFYATQDADASADDDGSYYTWSVSQLQAAVSPAEAQVLERLYDVGPRGEMASAPKTKDPAQNVLWVAAPPEQIANELRKPVDEINRLIEAEWHRLSCALLDHNPTGQLEQRGVRRRRRWQL